MMLGQKQGTLAEGLATTGRRLPLSLPLALGVLALLAVSSLSGPFGDSRVSSSTSPLSLPLLGSVLGGRPRRHPLALDDSCLKAETCACQATGPCERCKEPAFHMGMVGSTGPRYCGPNGLHQVGYCAQTEWGTVSLCVPLTPRPDLPTCPFDHEFISRKLFVPMARVLLKPFKSATFCLAKRRPSIISSNRWSLFSVG